MSLDIASIWFCVPWFTLGWFCQGNNLMNLMRLMLQQALVQQSCKMVMEQSCKLLQLHL